MRHLTLMAFAALAFAGCNGGEDFSDATVPGCPLGANCDINPRGDSLIELQGPRVANLGYQCGNSNGYTRDEAYTPAGLNIEVPAFHALCPANSRSVEFYIGSAIFEGNRVTLGSYKLPQQLRKGTYQLTLADLIESPRRTTVQDGAVGTASPALNRSALLHALNQQGNDPDAKIIIPGDPNLPADSGDPNTILDAQPELGAENGFNYSDFDEFKAAWQGFIDRVNTETPVDGFANDTAAYEGRLVEGNDRTRAGLYAFEIAGECIILEGCDFGGEDGSTVSFTLNALVLPDGDILGGGLGVRASEGGNEVLDYLGFSSSAGLSDILELQNQDDDSLSVNLLSAGIGDAPANNTDAQVAGRFLGSSLYAGVDIDGNSDFKLDFPSSGTSLQEEEKGEITGELLDEQLTGEPLPFRATKTGFVQAKPAIPAELVGDYTIRLMRACVDDDLGDDDDTGVCMDIADPDEDTDENEEISNAGGNYPETLGGETVSRERVRMDENDIGEFCLRISANGLVATGAGGVCGNTYGVGLVTRSFDDPKSANLSIRLAPGMDRRADTPHFNATIEGRVDLTVDANNCAPLYRLSDGNFDIGLRARWVEETFLPRIVLAGFSDEPSDPEARRFNSLRSGAVQFFKGAPGDAICDPMAPSS
ncbi:hypothetical protein [uncultured Alcanivorax sp.]|uniref:hypothetical protein n=1 Tax=uncultured Alcanivorax sp. TaxID=191215 RepID=UPI0026272837|nr:hypothetical protein [uncultured Alcanivorax sp.]